MGYRTVVILFNDHAHEWSKDPELGKKIIAGMNNIVDSDRCLHYRGKVVECAHADVQTLAVLDTYNMTPIVHSFWRQFESEHDAQVRLLKEAADKLGYSLRKKPTKNPLAGTKAVFLGDLDPK